jgi:NTE family protein
MKIGITFSGGGARGIAHLGVLQALNELGIFPDKIAGVSAGAIAGAMYAHGYAPKEILEIVSQFKISSFFNLSRFNRPGILNIEKFEPHLFKHLPHNRFEDLKIPLVVSATDVNLGEAVYFSEGELIKPLLASSCIPVLFSPIEFQGRWLVDGGIINGMIVEPLQDCEVIIGVHSNPFDKGYAIKSTHTLMVRCLTLSIHSNARSNFKNCDVVIEPLSLTKISALRLDKAKEIYQLGYEAVWEKKEEILRVCGK